MDNSERPISPSQVRYRPVDRCNLVYIIFYLLGIGSLIPWNFFITAKEYFQFKLRNTTEPIDYSFGNVQPSTDLQTSFESYVAIASNVPNLLFNILNALFTNIIPLKVRMVVSLVIMLVMFILTDCLVYVQTETWQTEFFILTMATVVIASGATSVICGALFGLSGMFPPQYTQAAMSGQAMGGTFAALADIVSLAGGGSVTSSAFGFFLSAVIVTFLSMLGYIALHYLHFSQFYMGRTTTGNLADSINYSIIVESGEEYSDTDATSPLLDNPVQVVNGKPGLKEVFKNIWPQAFSVFSVFTITLSLFPGVSSAIESTQKYTGAKVTNEYFSPLVCFLVFNSGDWTGRIIAGWIHLLPKEKTVRLILVTLARLLFIPLVLLCNAQPRSHLPVIFDNDILPVLFIVLLGLSNGYVSTSAMMHAPQKVPPVLAEVAGSWMAVFIAGGLACGSVISLGLVKLL